jgi:hypothetical protein
VNLRLGAADRCVYIGLPGWGKTTLVQELLAGVESAVIIDPKGEEREWTAWGRRHGYTVTRDPRYICRLPGDPTRGPTPRAKVVWLVDSMWIDDRRGWTRKGTPGYQWTDGLERIFTRGHTVAVFDDAMTTLPAGAHHPRGRKIITMGRAREVAAWIVAQAPMWLDTIALRTAEHCFAFTQPSVTWRDRLQEERGVNCDVLATLLPPDPQGTGPRTGEFAYHRIGAPAWELFHPISRRAGFRTQSVPPPNTDRPVSQDQPEGELHPVTTAPGGGTWEET